MQKLIKTIIQEIGEDPNREWLIDTPQRVTKMYKEIFAWYDQNPASLLTTFANDTTNEQIVWLAGIEFYSMCEHHMLPFFGEMHIYYIPWEKICWISKLARFVDIFAKRLQNQERLVSNIIDSLEMLMKPLWLFVVSEATHLCMCMRWVKKQKSVMQVIEIRWKFKDNMILQNQVFESIKIHKSH